MKTSFNYNAIRGVISLFLVLIFALFCGVAGAYGRQFYKQGQIVISGPPGDDLDNATVVKYLPNADLTIVHVDVGEETERIEHFADRGYVASLNYTAKLFFVPDDPYYPYQWNFPAVQSEEAWEISTGEGVIVAVLDSGLVPDGIDGLTCVRDDLAYNVLSPGDYPYDGLGHGTHVSGVIGQMTDNAEGAAGLAFNACIMPVKVVADDGETTFAEIADGVYYAVNHGAKVINLSLGTDASEEIFSVEYMDEALVYAFVKGVTVVCASGNDGYEKNVAYPAVFPTTIAVGATGSDGNVTEYTSRGMGLNLVAPGSGIIQEIHVEGWGWLYYPLEGTSMSAPHVSAIAALLLSKNNHLRPVKILETMMRTAEDLYEPGYDNSSGAGLVQAFDALTALRPGSGRGHEGHERGRDVR